MRRWIEEPAWRVREWLRDRRCRRSFRCLDCVLRDPVWLEVNPDEDGMLCLDCVEQRLGRPLRQGDLSLVEPNFSPSIFPRWARMEP